VNNVTVALRLVLERFSVLGGWGRPQEALSALGGRFAPPQPPGYIISKIALEPCNLAAVGLTPVMRLSGAIWQTARQRWVSSRS
jgi:hypothetical protein